MARSQNIFSLFKNKIKITNSEVIEMVSIAHRKKLGALLVFEKSQKLDSYIATGEILDAKLTSTLLLSLFNTFSPLHDGAVIIRNGRLHAAKVVLPLSSNEEHSKNYGTRHLAAIGISEVSDAFSVIVSEQTGRISYAKDKQIYLDISIEELLQKLTDEAKNL
jgi:diadenylate cyclase